jgi:hypothetical protein
VKSNKMHWAIGLLLLLGPGALVQDAAADDFSNILRRIESEYHVHRNYRFLLSVVGTAVKVSKPAGATNLKIAVFEDQNLFGSDPDVRLDEVVHSAAKSDWQPLLKSLSNRTGEHDYIYVQGRSKELKLLIVTVEPDETVVIQVNMKAHKLSDYINDKIKDNSSGG